jgi:hypothetical protein
MAPIVVPADLVSMMPTGATARTGATGDAADAAMAKTRAARKRRAESPSSEPNLPTPSTTNPRPARRVCRAPTPISPTGMCHPGKN